MTSTIGWVISRSHVSGFVEFLRMKDDSIEWSPAASLCTIFKEHAKAKEAADSLRDIEDLELIKIEISY